jgi:hypothetical protein
VETAIDAGWAFRLPVRCIREIYQFGARKDQDGWGEVLSVLTNEESIHIVITADVAGDPAATLTDPATILACVDG